MRNAYFPLIFLLLILAGLPARADDLDRIRTIKNFSDARLHAITEGTEPWPEALFPLSFWYEKDLKKLPQEYWKGLQDRERKWPEYIKHQRKIFQREYGADVKNPWDLFLKQQAEMKEPGYHQLARPVIKKKTLKRFVDIAHIPAQFFHDVQGTPVGHIRVFSYQLGRLRIIPFDIVEFTDTNQVVLPDGPESNPEEGDGIFRKNDLLFFMLVDAGHMVDPAWIRKRHPGITALQEMEISYRPDAEEGWVYVAAFSGSPPAKASFDYIAFHPEFSVTHTPITYGQCHPRKLKGKEGIFPTLETGTWLSAPSIGGRPLDILDHLRIRITLKYLIGKTFDDEDKLNVTFRAWYDGQVINYNRAAWKLSTPLGIGAPIVFDDIVADFNSVFNHITWYSPFNPSIFVKHLDVLVGEELNERVGKYREDLKVKFISEHNRDRRYEVDGIMSDREKTHNDRFSSWHLFTGFSGTVCMRTDYDDFLTEHGKRTLDWRDTAKHYGNYDNHLVIKDLSNRSEHFYVEWNAVPFFWNRDPGRYDWSNLDLILKRIDKPLTYTVDGKSRFRPGLYIHIPDVHAEEEKYEL